MTTFSELIAVESKFAGVITELGHPVSWLISGDDVHADVLVTARVYQFAHRTLRNYLLNIDTEEADEQRKIFLHGLRAYQSVHSQINVNYRLLNIQYRFDVDNLESSRDQGTHASYYAFHAWLTSYLVPNIRQINQHVCRVNVLDSMGCLPLKVV